MGYDATIVVQLKHIVAPWRVSLPAHVLQARGNVLKVDRFKYVKVAYHGLQELDKASKDKLYRSYAPGGDFYHRQFFERPYLWYSVNTCSGFLFFCVAA